MSSVMQSTAPRRKFSEFVQNLAATDVRFVQGAQGITRPTTRSTGNQSFAPASGCRASAQVGHAAQAEALGSFS
jgi:hypothetical protein